MLPVTAYIGLGSNLDDPQRQVGQAFQELDQLPLTRCQAYSPLYRSRPLGPPDQPDYINAVARVLTTLTPPVLLAALHAIERGHGRQRRQRWGARTLDLDLLLYGQLTQDDPQLTLPHPRLAERTFVLQPLHDLAPELQVPGLGALTELLIRCPPWPLERLADPPVSDHNSLPLPVRWDGAAPAESSE